MNSSAISNCKRCRVCGDHNFVFYNYDGLSCKSCKKFFLRNANTIKVFKCKNKNDNCPMTITSRKYCKKCRMNKCLEIGMKKELIHLKKLRTDTNNNKSIPNTNIITTCNTPKQIIDQSIDRLIVPIKTDIKLELKSYELKRIEEVQAATATWFNLTKDYQIEGQIYTLYQAVNFAEYFARNYVKFCKKNSTFKSLSNDDQIVLLKCSFPEMSSIYVSFYYDIENDGVPVVVNEFENVYFLKFGQGIRNSLRYRKDNPVYKKFILSMKNEIQNDSTIRDLIIIQLLFKNRSELSCHEFIHYNHLLYRHLLRRYLEHEFNDLIQAKNKYDRIIALLSQIENATKNVYEIYETELGINQVPQLLAEIYNLK